MQQVDIFWKGEDFSAVDDSLCICEICRKVYTRNSRSCDDLCDQCSNECDGLEEDYLALS